MGLNIEDYRLEQVHSFELPRFQRKYPKLDVGRWSGRYSARSLIVKDDGATQDVDECRRGSAKTRSQRELPDKRQSSSELMRSYKESPDHPWAVMVKKKASVHKTINFATTCILRCAQEYNNSACAWIRNIRLNTY